jgi:1,2-diacylglycerol 3-beta-glucosyltransferase
VHLARRPARVLSRLAIVMAVFGLVAVGETWVLTVGAGVLLLLFGALWPGLWLASLVRPLRSTISVPDGRDAGASPLISVLVPARNEGPVIGTLVSQMIGQDYPRWQLLVIANNCTDDTADRARAAAHSDPRVEVLEVDFRQGTKASALNLGLERARGEVILEVDADNRVNRNLLSELRRVFTDPSIDACQTQIRAANADSNLLTSLQDLEFLVYSEIWNRGRSAIASRVPLEERALPSGRP